MHDTQAELIERALLVGLERIGHDKWALQDALLELRELAESAGVTVVDSTTQYRDKPAAATFIGSGKAAEIGDRCRAETINTVIFDDDLSPAQGRNLGEVFGPQIKVIDRTELILDIFAQRARTREGQIQVHLAQMQYMLPRLTGLWTHLSRQRGGVGCRGPGETQLEVDRRRVQERITSLRHDLEQVRKNRRIERGGRQRLHWPAVSIIGYTNSGKSTLMNALTGAGVLAEDKLFATLDPTTRKLRLPNNQVILLSDTVGFLRKLPHHLVDSFRATLEEVVEAELLLHVVDVSHAQASEQVAAVKVVLQELDAADKPVVMVLNKIDRLGAAAPGPVGQASSLSSSLPAAATLRGEGADRAEAGPATALDKLEACPTLAKFRREYPDAVAISAKRGDNLGALLDEIGNRLRDRRTLVTLAIPHERSRTIALVYRAGHVLERHEVDGRVILKAQVPKLIAGELSPFVVEQQEAES